MKSIGVMYMEALRELLNQSSGEKSPFKRTIHVVWGPGKILLIIFFYKIFWKIILDEETGGIDGMGKFVHTEEFKQMNVGFVLDEGGPFVLPIYFLFYAERVTLCGF